MFALVNFLKGYIRIEVSGRFLERFINICIKRNIVLWDMERLDGNCFRANISTKAFFMLSSIKSKTGVKVRIAKREGLPLFVHKHRHRVAFIWGFIGFMIIIGITSSFVWAVEISGNQRVETQHIIEILEQCGLKPGAPKHRLNSNVIKEQFLMKESDVSWIWVDIKGTTAYVSIKERELAPHIFDPDVPVNVVSAKDGVVMEMVVKSGTPVVQLGDTVSKGDLLVSGAVDSEIVGARLIHSVAEIQAKVYYKDSLKTAEVVEKISDTGNSAILRSVVIGGFPINLFSKPPEFQYSRSDQVVKQLALWKNFSLPVSLVENYVYEQKSEQIQMTQEEAIQQARLNLYDGLMGQFAADTWVMDETISTEISPEGVIDVTLTLECRENIAVQQEILIEN